MLDPFDACALPSDLTELTFTAARPVLRWVGRFALCWMPEDLDAFDRTAQRGTDFANVRAMGPDWGFAASTSITATSAPRAGLACRSECRWRTMRPLSRGSTRPARPR